MDLQIEAITTSLSSLAIDETKIIKIQKWFRGCILRLKQLPLIMYKRTTLERNDAMEMPNRLLSYPTYRTYTAKNRYDKFSILNNFKPRKELYDITMPDYVDISYEVMVWTEYQEQLNTLVEQFQFHDGFAWGETFKFQCQLDGVSFNIINTPGEDRLVRATIGVRTKASLSLPFEDYRSAIDKRVSVKRVVFGDEQISFDTPNNPNDQITNTGDSFKKLL